MSPVSPTEAMYYKYYLLGKLRGLEKALNIVNRRDVDSATVRWLVREIEDVKTKMEEEE